jgi:hypothetical protein
MKNKRNTYLLLIAVLGIWGALIYRIFSFSNNEIQEPAVLIAGIKPYDLKPRDSIKIEVNYRDPFLGKPYADNMTVPSKKQITTKPAAEILWPAILYKGLVSDSGNKKKIYMLVINGQTYLMGAKQTEQEITVIGGNREYVDVSYKKHKQRINLLIQ